MKANELLDLLIEAERHMTETNSMLRGRRLSTLAHLIELDGIDQESYNKKAEVISEENKMDIDLLNRIRAAIKQHQEDVIDAFMSKAIYQPADYNSSCGL